MTLDIPNQEANTLARELARADRISITNAVISALRETIRNWMHKESPHEIAQKTFWRTRAVINKLNLKLSAFMLSILIPCSVTDEALAILMTTSLPISCMWL